MGTVKHAFVNPIADEPGFAGVKPSDWNADLTLVNVPGTDIINTFALAQTFTVAPIFTNQANTRTALGLGTAATQATGTSGTTIPLLDGINTWSAQNVFSTPLYASGMFATTVFASPSSNRLCGLNSSGFFLTSSRGILFYASGTDVGGSFDGCIARGGVPNSALFGGSALATGSATTRLEVNKAIAAITDATATAALTITIPNGANSGQVYVELCGSLGAGGAIGANEASATNCYTITLTRTTGVNAVAGISAASGTSSAAVAGAATVTCTAALSAVSGAVGASNTFTVNVTVTRSIGTSANHTCLVYAKLMNANASGMSIS